MALTTIANSNLISSVDFDTETLASTNSYVQAAQVDAGGFFNISFTMKVATQSIKWTVYAANLADLSDAVVVNAEATVVAAAVGTFAVSGAPYRYYFVKIKSAAADTPGTAIVTGIAKN